MDGRKTIKINPATGQLEEVADEQALNYNPDDISNLLKGAESSVSPEDEISSLVKNETPRPEQTPSELLNLYKTPEKLAPIKPKSQEQVNLTPGKDVSYKEDLPIVDTISASQAAPSDEMRAAMAKRDQNQMISGLIKGFTQIAGKGNADLSGINEIEKRSGQPVEDVLQQRKVKMEDELENPTSNVSKLVQRMVKEAFPGYNVDGFSAGQLKRAGIDVDKILQSKQIAEIRQQSSLESKQQRQQALDDKNTFRQQLLDQRKRENLEKAGLAFSKALESDQELKEFKKQGLGLSQVDQLVSEIKNGNTVAGGALGAKMARAMGEVGVLTEQDVVRYVQSGMLTQKVGDKLKKMMLGRPTDATLEELQHISSILKNNFASKIQPIYDKYANRLSRIHDIPIEESYFLMDSPNPNKKGQPQSTEQRQPQSEQNMVDSKSHAEKDEALKWANDNINDPKYSSQAKEILNRLGQ
jgi:hypothetical protein